MSSGGSSGDKYKELKRKGDDAYKVNNWERAIEHYTNALAEKIDSSDDKRSLLSNRSASFVYIQKFKEALDDSNECIKVDDTWFRGYQRRGDASLKLGDYKGAIAAFDEALKKNVDKSDSNATNVDLKKKIAAANELILQNSFQAKLPFYLKCTIFISALLYMIPFTGSFSSKMYKVFVFSAMASCITAVIKKHGMIKFNMDYLQKIVPDTNTQRIMLCFILLSARMATFMFMVPVLVFEVANSTEAITKWALADEVNLKERMGPMIAKYQPGANVDQIFQLIKDSRRVREMKNSLIQMSCQIEVMCGVFLIIQLVLPTRDIMSLFMWWQYLKMRYTFDDKDERNVAKAFTSVDQQLSGYLEHRFVPSVVRTVYNKAKDFLIKQGEPPSTASGSAGGGGFLSNLTSKCTVM